MASLGSLLFGSPPAVAGPNEGGTLILHADLGITYSDGQGYCGASSYVHGTDPVVTLTSATPVVFHALATFPTSSTPRLAGVAFGVEYPSSFRVLDSGSCADFELADPTWPASGTGTALTWEQPDTSKVVEVYWFAGYSYEGGPSPFYLREHPGSGGVFADDSVPAAPDSIADFGEIGIHTYGYSPVASETPLSGEFDGGIEICLVRDTPIIDTFFDPAATYAVEGVRTFDAELRDSLYAIGTVSIEKVFPSREWGDTLQPTVTGDWVVVPDLSVYYRITTESPEDDSLHARSLSQVWSSVRYAYHLNDPDAGIPQTIPDDPYFDSWGSQEEDMQWHLKNDGYRTISYCGDAIEGMDVRIADLAEWLEYSGSAGPVVIGLADVGVWNDHEDLNVIAEWNREGDTLDYCGDHGTILAGAAGAVTNNSTGVASVCPNCPIMDIDLHLGTTNCENSTGSANCNLFPQAIDEALSWSLGEAENGIYRRLGAISNATNCRHLPSLMPIMYDAYARGVVPVNAAEYYDGPDAHRFQPIEHQWPECAPFIVTTGGYNWRGEFLDSGRNCNEASTGAVLAGPHAIRISAPASGRSLSTQLAHINDGYSNTALGTSAASAIVNGAVTLLQTIYSSDTQPPWPAAMLEARYMVGLLTASALPYGSDPAAYSSRRCTECVTTDYGPGRINIEGAKLLMDFWKAWPWEAGDEYWTVREVGFTSEGADIDLIKSVEEVSGAVWNVWRLTVPVQIPAYDGDPQLPLPNYVAFPYQSRGLEFNPVYTNTFFFGERNTAMVTQAIDLARFGARGCYLTIDQTDGSALVESYLLSEYVNGVDRWLVHPLDAKMCYFEFQNNPAADLDTELAEGVGAPGATLLGTPGPGPFSVNLSLTRPQRVSIAVHDAGGRAIARIHDASMGAGSHSVSWDGTDQAGRRVPVGLYFVNIEAEEFRRASKVVILSR